MAEASDNPYELSGSPLNPNLLTAGLNAATPAGVGGSALAIKGPAAPTTTPVQNVTDILKMQELQRSLAAKSRAGQIMALAPTLDDGLAAMEKDSTVAGYGSDVIATLQSVSNAATSQAGERQTQATSGLNSVMQGLLGAVNDPTTFDKDVASRLPTLSPSAQKAVMKAIPSIKASLFDGLDKLDPQTATTEYQRRLGAMIVGAGFSPDGVRAVTGQLAPQLVTVTGPKGEQITLQAGGPITGDGSAEDVLSRGPTTDTAAQLSGEGQLGAGIETEMSGTASVVPQVLTSMNNTIEALGKIQPGGGADIRSGLGKSLQFFKNAGVTGISDDLINKVANGNLAASQTLSALLKTYATGQLKQAVSGTGAGQVAAEVQAFITLLDQTTDPQAILDIMRNGQQTLQAEYQKSQTFPEFKQLLAGKGDPAEVAKAQAFGLPGFYAWYNAYRYNPKNLPTQTPGGANLAIPDKPASTGTVGAGTDKQKILDDLFGQ